MKYLLNTNIISEFFSKKLNKKVIIFFQNISDNDLYLFVVIIGKIKFGMANFILITRNEKDFSNLDLEIVNPLN